MHKNSMRKVTGKSREQETLGLGLTRRTGCGWMDRHQVQCRGPVRRPDGWFWVLS